MDFDFEDPPCCSQPEDQYLFICYCMSKLGLCLSGRLLICFDAGCKVTRQLEKIRHPQGFLKSHFVWGVIGHCIPERETLSILLRRPVLLADTLNVDNRGTNYYTLAYGQWTKPLLWLMPNDCQCKSLASNILCQNRPPHLPITLSFSWCVSEGAKTKVGGPSATHLQPGRDTGLGLFLSSALHNPSG